MRMALFPARACVPAVRKLLNRSAPVIAYLGSFDIARVGGANPPSEPSDSFFSRLATALARNIDGEGKKCDKFSLAHQSTSIQSSVSAACICTQSPSRTSVSLYIVARNGKGRKWKTRRTKAGRKVARVKGRLRPRRGDRHGSRQPTGRHTRKGSTREGRYNEIGFRLARSRESGLY